MRITSKGQVTIPQHIREQAGLLPMTEVEFGFQEGVVTLRAAAPGTAGDRGAAILHHLRGRFRNTRERMTTDEIMALTRGE
ncbi:MAG: AbrB/MazE/SpoVT family DNA-binding domain-containing protein [Acetobacteraceae bacterium]|nr:AbrB/MazE/SpoVT family DNA-binding domain-containing protein [Acetobacteraceae bacterium]